MSVPSPTTRRDFLRGRSLADAATAVLPDPGALPPGAGPFGRLGSSDELTLLTASRRAMACRFEIVLPATRRDAIAAASAALDEVDQLEDQLTVYNDDSEVSRINLLAAAAPVPVEPRLFDLFETALRLNAATDGAFDIAAGALVKCWGFFRGPKRVPSADELSDVMRRVGSGHIVLDRERRTMAFDRPGMEINLGAIGKGYALDRAGERLRDDWGVAAALLHGGRSSVLGVGTPGDGATDDGWLVGIAHPWREGERIATVRLRDQALGTSGATIQWFEANGRRFGHILDPRTGWPAAGQTCVSVIAPTAAEADALSTALFVLGPDKAREFCQRRRDVGAVLVSTDGPTGPVDIELLGLAQLATPCHETHTDDGQWSTIDY
jgi:thiamine biosynthesis lipoprotein